MEVFSDVTQEVLYGGWCGLMTAAWEGLSGMWFVSGEGVYHCVSEFGDTVQYLVVYGLRL